MSHTQVAIFILELALLAALPIVVIKRAQQRRKDIFDLFGKSGLLLTVAFFTIQLNKLVAWYYGYL